jgi:hypothetical protein
MTTDPSGERDTAPADEPEESAEPAETQEAAPEKPAVDRQPLPERKPSRREEAVEFRKTTQAKLADVEARFSKIDAIENQIRELRHIAERNIRSGDGGQREQRNADDMAQKLGTLRKERWEAYARNDAVAVDRIEDEIMELRADAIAERKIMEFRKSQPQPLPAWLTRLESEHSEVVDHPHGRHLVEAHYATLVQGGRSPGAETAREAFEYVSGFLGKKPPKVPANGKNPYLSMVSGRPASAGGGSDGGEHVDLPSDWQKIAKGFKMSENDYKSQFAKSNPTKVSKR